MTARILEFRRKVVEIATSAEGQIVLIFLGYVLLAFGLIKLLGVWM